MKICDITKFYAETSGGVKTYLHRKAEYLTNCLGWEHILIVPGPEDTVIREGPRKVFRVRGPLVPARRPYRFLLNPWRVREILMEEVPDLIEIGSPYIVPWVAFSALPRPRPAVTGFYHADFPRAYARELGRKLGPRTARCFESVAWAYARAVYRRCDLTLAASDYVASVLLLRGIAPVRQIPLGIDLALFNPKRRSETVRERLGATPGQVLILYTGRLTVEKGLSVLLKAFESLPRDRYRLILVGDGPYRASVEAFVARHPNTTYLGYCADPDRLADIFASCDLFVSLGRYETFGLTVLEALASGLPVIGAKEGAVAELIEEGTGATVDPDAPLSLAEKIERLSSEDLRAMGLLGRSAVERKYSWDRSFDALASVYRELVDAGSPGRRWSPGPETRVA